MTGRHVEVDGQQVGRRESKVSAVVLGLRVAPFIHKGRARRRGKKKPRWHFCSCFFFRWIADDDEAIWRFVVTPKEAHFDKQEMVIDFQLIPQENESATGWLTKNASRPDVSSLNDSEIVSLIFLFEVSK